MRFSTVAFMASSALASEAPVLTDYATNLVTVTACPPSVTNCPARSMTSSVITSVVSEPTSTAYSTKVHTITSCAPDVTDCPARSTVMSTETMPASTPSVPVGPPSSIIYPSPGTNNTMGILPIVPSQPATQPPAEGNPPAPTSTETEAPVETGTPGEGETPGETCEGSTVTAITKSYTTVLTSVEYSTIQAPCATGTPPELPTGKLPVPTPGVPSPPGNNTTPPPLTGGASSMTGSALFAAAAGLVAVMLA